MNGFLPPYQGQPVEVETLVANFSGGINTGLAEESIPSTSASDGYGITSEDYPDIETIKVNKTVLDSLTAMNGLGKRKNTQLVVVEGTTVNIVDPDDGTVDDTFSLTVTDEAHIINFLDDTIVVNGTDRKKYNGTTASTVTDMPTLNALAVHNNRLFGIDFSNDNLYVSNLADVDDWSTAGDTLVEPIYSDEGENNTAIQKYADHVVIFKPNSMHQLYGYTISNYTVIAISTNIGCINQKTVKEVNERLYFMDRNGIYVYTGGKPKRINYQLDRYWKNIDWDKASDICAGTDGLHYYITFYLTGESNPRTYMFDTEKEVWLPHSKSNKYKYYQELDNRMFVLDDTGDELAEYQEGTSSTAVPFSWVSKQFTQGTIARFKDWKGMYILYELTAGSFTIDLSKDGGTFETVHTVAANASNKVERIFLPLIIAKRSKRLQIRITGAAQVKIKQLELQARVV